MSVLFHWMVDHVKSHPSTRKMANVVLRGAHFFDLSNLGSPGYEERKLDPKLMFLPFPHSVFEMAFDDKTRMLWVCKQTGKRSVLQGYISADGTVNTGPPFLVVFSKEFGPLIKQVSCDGVPDFTEDEIQAMVWPFLWCLSRTNGPLHHRVRRSWAPEQRKLLKGCGASFYSGYDEIVLRPRIDHGRDPARGDSGIHKCLHEVRSHLRRYKSGRVVQVAAHRRGNPAYGVKLQSPYLIEEDSE